MTMHRDLPEAVEELRGRVERLESMLPKSVSPSSPVSHENKGGDMGSRRTDDQQAHPDRDDTPVEALVDALHDPVGQSAPGLRTERVTLEIVQESCCPEACEWDWDEILRFKTSTLAEGESVRVVPEAEASGRIAEVEKQRDEYRRSWLAEGYHATRLVAERDASRDNADALAARVAELESERDDALEQVAELERAALKAEQQAAAEPVMESATAARHLFDTGHRISPFMTLDSASEGCSLNVKFRSLADGQAFHGAMVRFFGNAPAASGEAAAEPVASVSIHYDTSAADAKKAGMDVRPLRRPQHHSSDALAWGVMLPKTGGLYDHFDFEHEAVAVCESVRKVDGVEATVVPLYSAPPPAAGWLTEPERDAVSMASREIVNRMPDWGVGETVAATLDGLLIRNAPPEVVLPKGHGGPKLDTETTIQRRDRQWIAALAAAGVECQS